MQIYIVGPVSIKANENFTLASGIKYGIAMGYTFKKNFGFEIGMDYFNVNKWFNIYDKKTKNDWHYQSINIYPLFTFAVENKKSTFIGKAGAIIGVAKMNKSFIYIDENKNEDVWYIGDFDTKLNLGYTVGWEYNYRILKYLSLSAEMGIECYKYTPNKATVQRPELNYYNQKIEYVKNYTGKYSPSYYYDDDYYPKKDLRFQESILFNSIYFGIGIKYNIF
jgi:hypothetical protein